MKKISKKGFIIILVIAFLTILILVASVIVNIGCSEILQTRARNDSLAASYVAIAGAEMMYANLKNKTTILWPQIITSSVTTRYSGGQTVGTFTATANTISSDILGIVSEANVNGHRFSKSVKYKFSSPYTNGFPVGSAGPMEIYGQRLLVFRSWVRVEGPIASGSTITTNNYVQMKGDQSILENQNIQASSFWWKYDVDSDSWTEKSTYDTLGTGVYVTDQTADSRVTIEDALGDPAQEAIFRTNDINSDGEVNDKDAFTAFYTVELNKKNLGLAEGQANHFNGDQLLGPGDVPQGRTIIFVNGNVDILFNDQNWSQYACDHTIVATGNITIVQPTNGSDDRLTLVSYGDIDTGGVRAFGGVRGDMIAYANGSFNAYYGGKTDGTIFAKDNVYIDTVLPIPGLLNRDLNKGKDNWADPDDRPLGLPLGYPTISTTFNIDENQKAVWENN